METGFTSYVVVVKTSAETDALRLIDKWSTVLSLIATYKISGETQDYTLLQIDGIYKTDSSKPLTKFIMNTFDFVALHQEHTNYVLVEYEEDWEEFCRNVFKEENDIKMIYYHCKTIEERYDSFLDANPCLKMCMDLTCERMDRITKNIYKLDFENCAEWLFQSEEDLLLLDEATMINYSVEAIDGIKKDEYKVAILNQKTCI